MVKGRRLLADLDPELKKRLFRALLEEDLTFTDWLRKQVNVYLKEKKAKEKKAKEKKAKGKRRKTVGTSTQEGERPMSQSKPKIVEVEGGEFISKFGVTIVGLSEEDCPVDGEPRDVDWENCSIVRLLCNTCEMVFDVEPQAPREYGRRIPLCPTGCNFSLLQQWVKEQERKKNM